MYEALSGISVTGGKDLQSLALIVEPVRRIGILLLNDKGGEPENLGTAFIRLEDGARRDCQ
jgi:hypothetical protein